MSEPVRIVVVDDHVLFRRGLIGLLSEMKNFEVVGEASNGIEALKVIVDQCPDIVLLDVNMPEMGGVQTLSEMKEAGIQSRVLMLTISQNDEDLIGSIRAGASGYFLKNTEPETLRKMILDVVEGKSVLAPEIIDQVFRMMRSGQLGVAQMLTEREIEVLRLLSRGASTAKIAERMSISDNTVKTHIRNILSKLEAGSRAEAVKKAVQMNLI